MNGLGTCTTFRRVATLCGLVTLGTVSLMPLAGAQDQAANPALLKVSSCVSDRRHIMVLMLIDESASLKKTDPKNERITAAQSAVESLAGLSEHEIDGKKPVVEVAVSGFSVEYQRRLDWTSVGYSNVEDLRNKIDAEFTSKNQGLDTDYVAALAGARSELADRLKATGVSPIPCQVIMWFTDGAFSIEDRTSAARLAAGNNKSFKEWSPGIDLTVKGSGKNAEAAGTVVLCKAGGEVDRLREDDVTTVAIALVTELEPADEEFLRSLVVGKSTSGKTCGEKPGEQLGFYSPVDDLSELIASFDAIANVLGYGTQGKPEKGMEPGSERTFPVDIGMSRFHIQVQTGAPGRSVTFTAPGSAALQLPDKGTANTQIGASKLRYAWLSPDVVSVDVDLAAPPYTWAGGWNVKIGSDTAGSVAKTGGFRIFYYGDLAAEMTAGSVIKREGDSTVSVQITDRVTGKTPTPEFLEAVKLNAIATIENGNNSPQTLVLDKAVEDSAGAQTGLSGLFSPEKPGKGDNAEVAIDFNVTTKSGFALHPTQSTFKPKFDEAAQVDSCKPNCPAGSDSKRIGFAKVAPFVGGFGGLLLLGGLGLLAKRKYAGPKLPAYNKNTRWAVMPVRVRTDDLGRPSVCTVDLSGVERPITFLTDSFSNGLSTQRTSKMDLGGFTVRAESKDIAIVEFPGHFVLSSTVPDNPAVALRVPAALSPAWYLAGRAVQGGAAPGGKSLPSTAAAQPANPNRTYGRSPTVLIDPSVWNPVTAVESSTSGNEGKTQSPWGGSQKPPAGLPGGNATVNVFAQANQIASQLQPGMERLGRSYVEGSLLIVVGDPSQLEGVDHSLRFELPTRALKIAGL